jgi:hypothetical protein
MNPDLYGAWLTAGNNLQPVGAWLAGNWWWLAATAAAVFAAWALRRFIRSGLDDYRACNDRIAADRITHTQDWPEPPAPGCDQLLLDACNDICPDHARKEDRP